MCKLVYAFDADRPGSAPLWTHDLRAAQPSAATKPWPGQIGGEFVSASYASEGKRSVCRL